MKLKYYPFLLLITICPVLSAKNVVISSSQTSPMINYAIGKLNDISQTFGNPVKRSSLRELNIANVIVILQTDSAAGKLYPQIKNQKLAAEGFQIVRSGNKVIIIGADEKGAMYGILDVAEQMFATRYGNGTGPTALEAWKNYANTLAIYNKESYPFIIAKDEFSWKAMQSQVDKDIELANAPSAKNDS